MNLSFINVPLDVTENLNFFVEIVQSTHLIQIPYTQDSVMALLQKKYNQLFRYCLHIS